MAGGRFHGKAYLGYPEGGDWLEREHHLYCDQEIQRSEPGFLCHALVSKAQVQASETDELIDRIYDGSADMLFASLLSRKALSGEQIERLKRIVEEGK